MQGKYYPPEFEKSKFHCIHCGVYSAQYWKKLEYKNERGYSFESKIAYCICEHCEKWSYWYNKKMIIPDESPVQPPHVDMPEECLTEYNEARSIVSKSPRAAAALIRLAIQKLMKVLGEKGGNIDKDIKSLVSKGLPVQIQKALDYCRVVGNNGAHPGEIDLNDTPEMVHMMFNMINMIVEDRITKPRELDEIYGMLPEGALEAIEKRDNK